MNWYDDHTPKNPRIRLTSGEEFSPQRVNFVRLVYLQPTSQAFEVDLLVIMLMEENAVANAVEIQLNLRPSFSIGNYCKLVVQTPEKVRERVEIGEGFVREISAKIWEAHRGAAIFAKLLAQHKLGNAMIIKAIFPEIRS
ncbi:MAG: hypothetical protein ONB46_07280 [candidate division KSB1 bacterium]|nr:hypothetical protein [candidate division KSB1 bacterium]